MKSRLARAVLVTWCLAGVLAAAAILATGALGCEDCAAEGEYCVDLDCCDELVCSYDQTAGYRCR